MRETQPPLTPGRCLTGSAISGALGLAVFALTRGIAQTLTAHPIHSQNPLVLRLAGVVRTALLGGGTLAVVVLAVFTLGLLALAVQVAWSPPDA
ncbi:hypothetical protein GlitD10_1587 [Gloeomargarita lithophora Alchichica-D10]|uniref:DUF3082 domain-containing protein n=1 Tax=Gloeomargarita lithophora Alchichica-D10 TaxID=1188229 RepID=A0A1J0ADC3_9CYAN|nr:DUF3082 domain-containing protein [Gloeomargarita lithophora]APB33911.1 hypothetical protein GlitD10_1587 [Gloeomargarita lithophora Alchichica-D10]